MLSSKARWAVVSGLAANTTILSVATIGNHKRQEELSGVPQGSVLGLILFLLFVNQLPEWIKSNIFVDDLKVWRRIITMAPPPVHLSSSAIPFQHYLNPTHMSLLLHLISPRRSIPSATMLSWASSPGSSFLITSTTGLSFSSEDTHIVPNSDMSVPVSKKLWRVSSGDPISVPLLTS